MRRGDAQVFGEQYRPVKIETKVLAYPDRMSDFLFDRHVVALAVVGARALLTGAVAVI